VAHALWRIAMQATSFAAGGKRRSPSSVAAAQPSIHPPETFSNLSRINLEFRWLNHQLSDNFNLSPLSSSVIQKRDQCDQYILNGNGNVSPDAIVEKPSRIELAYASSKTDLEFK
jgi:hypothetical protein